MHRRHRTAMAMALAMPLTLLAACGQDDTSAQTNTAEQAAMSQPAADAAPPEPPQTPELQPGTIKDDTDRYKFSYSWPAAVAAIPPLVALLKQESDEKLATLKKDSADWQKEGDERGFDAPPQSYSKEWKVVTDLPRFLSLSADIYTYSGGAHGMSLSDGLVWDRQAREAIAPKDMFVSAGSLDRAARTRFCEELDRQRARKRGSAVIRGSDSFSDCIAPVANSTVILGSASGQAFDRVGFLVPPYNAGPYAEGEYEVTLPVDAALIDAVKPEYQRFFTPAD